MILALGRLADILGRKQLYLFGIAVFTCASLGCGLAWSADGLILFQLMQAIGAASVCYQHDRAAGESLSAGTDQPDPGPQCRGCRRVVRLRAFDRRRIGNLVRVACAPPGRRAVGCLVLLRRPRHPAGKPGRFTGNLRSTGRHPVVRRAWKPRDGIVRRRCTGLEASGDSGRIRSAILAGRAFARLQMRRAHPLVDLAILRSRSLVLAYYASFMMALVQMATLERRFSCRVNATSRHLTLPCVPARAWRCRGPLQQRTTAPGPCQRGSPVRPVSPFTAGPMFLLAISASANTIGSPENPGLTAGADPCRRKWRPMASR